MKLCILDNDDLDPAAVPIWGSYATMFERLLRDAGFQGDVEAFSARHRQYPDSFDAYDAVLLTGSRADAFSKEPWVADLCSRVSALLEQKKRLIGVCFGHQLIAHCLGAKVDRAPHGWGLGRHTYTWHEPQYFEVHTEQSVCWPVTRTRCWSCPQARVCWPAIRTVLLRLMPWVSRCCAYSLTRSLTPSTARFCWKNAEPSMVRCSIRKPCRACISATMALAWRT